MVHEIVILLDGLKDDHVAIADVAVVFGTTVNEDGSLSERLKARLDKGLELYTDSIVKEIYVSGGLGKEGFYEGSKMAEYLISKGVPQRAIKVDDKGNNTHRTAQNFVRDYSEFRSVILVTQYFHISRSKLAFRQVGLKSVFGAHCTHFEWRDIYSSFREFFGYYKYLLMY